MYLCMYTGIIYVAILNKNTQGARKLQGQSEATTVNDYMQPNLDIKLRLRINYVQYGFLRLLSFMQYVCVCP